MPIVVEGSPLERFSFYMTGSSAQGSLMVIGDPDSKLYKEPWIHCPLASPSKSTSGWTIGVDHIKVGDKILGIDIPLYATVDTGSSVIGVDAALWNSHLRREIVKSAVNCKSVSEVKDILACQGQLPDISLRVTTVDGHKEELVLRNEDYNIKFIEFQPIEFLSSQGIQLLLGDSFLRKYYTEFNYKDRRLSFAVRVKKKGDFVFWVVLLAILALAIGTGGCFYAHKSYGITFFRSVSQSDGRQDISSPHEQPAARGIVYSGQLGTTTQYTNELERPLVPSTPAPGVSMGTGYRLSDGQQLTDRNDGFFSGILRRNNAPSRAAPDAQTMRAQRERLLSTVNLRVIRDL